MSSNWETSLHELREFIARNSGISIQEKIVRINEQVRPEFYRLFDTVLSSFAREKLGNLIADIVPLSDSYKAQAHLLSERLGLEGLLQPANIQELLDDPEKKVRAILFDHLFQLLKGKCGIESFERTGGKHEI